MKKQLLILLALCTASISFGQVVLYDNFETTGNPDLITIGYDGEGTFSEAATPPNTLTGSTVSASYARAEWASGGYDNFQYTLDRNLVDVSSFASTTPGAGNKFKMDVATNAPIGTRILIKLESTLAANANKHHSEYEAFTTVTGNTWETLEFTWTGAAGNGLAATDVNKLIVFFAPASTTNNSTYYFDNIYGPALVAPASTNHASLLVADSKLYPNPTSGSTNIELNLKSTANVKVVLNDIMGKELKVIAESNTNSLNESFDVTGLTKGIYSVTYLVNAVPAKTEKLIVK